MAKFKAILEKPEFSHDMKRLKIRFRTLPSDLDKLIDYSIALYHKDKIDNKGIFPITGIGFERPTIYKVTKFACQSLKGKGANTGLRLIYTYFEEEDRIELIEIYYKERMDTECDKVRIKRLYSK